MDSLNKGAFNFFRSDTQRDLALLTKALDASISGIIITDNTLPDNPIVYCNNAFLEISGYDRTDIIGHNCRFLQKNDRDQPERELLRKAIENGESCVVDIRNYKKDGTLFYNNLFVSPVKDENGNVQFFIGVQNNVTQRVKAEIKLREQQALMEKRIVERTQHLKESKDYLNSIVQTVRESLIVLDPTFKILSVNDHFIKVFKVTRDDTIGKEMYELGNGQWNIPRLKELLETVLPTNNPVEEFEVEHDFPRIGHKLMVLNAYRVELEGEYKDRILIAIEDITDRREIERRKDDFLSIASHELKTPLTTIKGFIHLMKSTVPAEADGKFKAALEKTDVYVERLNSLIAELLDVSRIQTGNIELHKEDFEFDKMVAETVDGLQTATKSHQITVDGATHSIYNGDESHIIQVLNNLLSNAIKYSPGSDKVRVHLSEVGNYIKVSVTDYGLGINHQDQKKIFDRFYRVGEIQQHYPGMGIGLYVCDQIIKNHGGSLWVESEPGKGSTFSFTLPVHTEHQQ
ncbi:PAS domain-containing sensor histidine kinase [Mucilaginibacter ginkgonis]|uniref:histidine kinase n=1 Tax=Mucilaginibacter ginkgonis TaxID=2682091 RepID=A0A6I4IMT5_9SPHI|nr:PAS domain-containing sensor histidine kinase [Mucilaginibacter ginkgonis]QQL51007.1 PAS domain-containing protein [Mucilaginibacter ginkgonis]